MNDKIKKDLAILETLSDSKALVPAPAHVDNLKSYLKEVSRYKLLTIEEERELTKELFETGDIEVAKKLVMANLRLVVKIAMEYRKSYANVLDLIQEGNLGLMKAVSKYDPTKGAKLSYYASWWIKSYILKFILDNFRLIKIGTTADQKKLFYNLMREKDRLMSQGIEPTTKLISENLNVSEKSVVEMEKRLGAESGEISFDMNVTNDASSLHSVIADSTDIEGAVSSEQELEILKNNLGEFVKELKPRDKDIFQKRLLDEVPSSLQSIANDYGVSRERIRQIESRLLNKLKVYMSEHIR